MKLRVSDVCWYVVCPRRSRLLAEGRYLPQKGKKNKYMKAGIEFHKNYSAPYKSFDRRLLMYQLWDNYGRVFYRNLDEDTVVCGIPDDYRVLNVKVRPAGELSKVVSVLEIKTTSRKRVLYSQLEAAKFQLQLYIWILEPILQDLGYELHCRHYVEFYSQKDGRLMKRIVVHAVKSMEKRLRYILDSWKGLEKVKYPPFKVCKSCPRSIKERCNRWNEYVESKRLLH